MFGYYIHKERINIKNKQDGTNMFLQVEPSRQQSQNESHSFPFLSILYIFLHDGMDDLDLHTKNKSE
jgi:hypothetical protein